MCNEGVLILVVEYLLSESVFDSRHYVSSFVITSLLLRSSKVTGVLQPIKENRCEF